MKHRNLFVSCVIAICIVGLVAACMSENTFRAGQEVEKQWAAAIADGVVTPVEMQEHNRLLKLYFDSAADDSKSIDWGNLATQAVLTLFGGGAVWIARNKREANMWGTPEAPKAA